MPPRFRITLLTATAATVVAFTLLVLLGRPGGRSAGVSSSPAGGASITAPSSSGFDGAALPAGLRAPGFTLAEQSGQAVSLGQFRGQVVVLAFLDSACGPGCVLIAQQIRGALDELSRAPAVLIVSLDPRAESPAQVGRFLAQVSLSGRVHYLTGSVSRLRPLWHAYRAAPASSASRVPDSFARVLLIDRRGFERVLFGVEQLTPESLAHDIRRLQSQP